MSAMELNPWHFIKRAMFKLDAEAAHHAVVAGVRGLSDIMPLFLDRLSGRHTASGTLYNPEVFGLKFLSAVGLAAGFDKNAEIVSALPHLGFGFCEIGTVTPRPQDGNPRPRLLRDPSDQSLFNRMGFNNHGAVVIARRLAEHRPRLPATFRVGVNIGKNKETEGQAIARDYAEAARPFLDLADFYVVNVSSPNTPGLRALQAAESLAPILDAVQTEISTRGRAIPLLVKLAPELEDAELAALIEFFQTRKLAGLVLTNTLGGQTSLGPGGWSGGRVREPARDALIRARRLSPSFPIISVGGIDSVPVARERVALGAELVELYSGWIYQGPRLPIEIAQGLAAASVIRE